MWSRWPWQKLQKDDAYIEGKSQQKAQNLFTQLYTKVGADIIFISEPYRERTGGRWFVVNFGTGVVWLPNIQAFNVVDHNSGFVSVKEQNTYFVSFYLTQNDAGDLAVVGDFNTKVLEWEKLEPIPGEE